MYTNELNYMFGPTILHDLTKSITFRCDFLQLYDMKLSLDILKNEYQLLF